MLKAKIFSTITVNALTSTTKNPNQPSIKNKNKKIYFVFVFVGKLLHLNVFRNNNLEHL